MNSNRRVVITGIGVVAPNAVGKNNFAEALRGMKSGIAFVPELAKYNLSCQIGGEPPLTDEYKQQHLPELLNKLLDNHGVIYGCLAGLEAWRDANLPIDADNILGTAGIVFGSGALGMDEFIGSRLDLIKSGNVKKLGTRSTTQSMNSGVAAYLTGILGFGNRVMSNSSACSTGTEAVILGYEHIAAGKASVMLCGSSEGKGHFIWGGFDAMRVLCRDSNDNPTFGSRPLNNTSAGFVPGAGGGALVLEELDSAIARGATIYAEILGGEINSGGQRMGGSMTAPNNSAVQNCIGGAIKNSNIKASQIEMISGHLTSTMADSLEVANWKAALNLKNQNFPFISAPKSLIGHCIGAAGSIELVACVLQLTESFVHGNLNVEDIHPEIKKMIPAEKILASTTEMDVNTIAKANFGFGDVNSCVILRKFQQ